MTGSHSSERELADFLLCRSWEWTMCASFAYSVLQQFETHLAELYDMFSEVLAGDAEASALFASLATDERSHAAEIAYLNYLASTDSSEFTPVNLDTRELLASTVKVKRARDAVSTMTADSALQVALDLEGEAADYHARMALLEANASAVGLLRELGEADEGHRGRLAQFMEQRRSPS
jgi:rubrerythrin